MLKNNKLEWTLLLIIVNISFYFITFRKPPNTINKANKILCFTHWTFCNFFKRFCVIFFFIHFFFRLFVIFVININNNVLRMLRMWSVFCLTRPFITTQENSWKSTSSVRCLLYGFSVEGRYAQPYGNLSPRQRIHSEKS